MPSLVIAGSGTDVGKTFVSTLLIEGLRLRGNPCRAVKPVASGVDPAALESSDAGRLLIASGLAVTAENIAAISPWSYPLASSPHHASEAAGQRIDMVSLIAWCEKLNTASATFIIETAGGVMTPITRRHHMLDWMEALALPVLLIGDTALGSISSTLTAAAALRRTKLKLIGIGVSESVTPSLLLSEQCAALSGFLPDLPIYGLPRLDDAGKAAHAAEFAEWIAACHDRSRNDG